MWYDNKLHKRRSLQQKDITASGISTTLMSELKGTVTELLPSWYGPGKMVGRRIEDSKKTRLQQLLRNLS
uniref:Uncharacterized protein n=1 Tax=Salix viminalis TaxID=40686 RepID=A0A6N2LUW9_SALVM